MFSFVMSIHQSLFFKCSKIDYIIFEHLINRTVNDAKDNFTEQNIIKCSKNDVNEKKSRYHSKSVC